MRHESTESATLELYLEDMAEQAKLEGPRQVSFGWLSLTLAPRRNKTLVQSESEPPPETEQKQSLPKK